MDRAVPVGVAEPCRDRFDAPRLLADLYSRGWLRENVRRVSVHNEGDTFNRVHMQERMVKPRGRRRRVDLRNQRLGAP